MSVRAAAASPRVERVNLALFMLMCAIWGVTWIAIKAGLEALPPFVFAGSRFVAAGGILLAAAQFWSAARPNARDILLFLATGLLNITGAYGFLFWGMQFVGSGLSAVIDLSLIPVLLLALGILFGEDAWSARKIAGIALGVAGLLVIFAPRLGGDASTGETLGIAAIVASTLVYCLGSVLSRPLLRAHPVLLVSGVEMLIGGLGLCVLSLLVEDWPAGLVFRFFEPAVLSSWLVLTLGGAVFAFTIYMRLLRDWGPARAGAYAFVTPLVAVLLGGLVYGEPFGASETVGSALMLAAAAVALRAKARDAEDRQRGRT